MKDQFKQSVQDQLGDLDFEDDTDPPSEDTYRTLDTSDVRLQYTDELTNQAYSCRVAECECGEGLLFVVEPEAYDIVVGLDHTTPLELCWTPHPWETSEYGGSESLASQQAAEVTCSDCGSTQTFPFGKDGGLYVECEELPALDVPVAKRCLPYRTSPKSSWTVFDPHTR